MARYRRLLLMLILPPALLACSAAARFLGSVGGPTNVGASPSAIGLPEAEAPQTEDGSCPAEHIAETWAYFLLEPYPNDASVADEKVLFFYDYPELIALRTQILKGLCAAQP